MSQGHPLKNLVFALASFFLVSCQSNPGASLAPVVASNQGGQGDSFTGGDQRDLLVEGFRAAAVRTLTRFVSYGQVAPELCNSSVVGNPVANLVRGMSYSARTSCRAFFAQYGAALIDRWSDPRTFQVSFTKEDLKVKGLENDDIDVQAKTTDDPHALIFVEDRGELLQDPYGFGMLVLHEGMHHFQSLDDRQAGPDGFEGNWGKRRFINSLVAALIMAGYEAGLLADLALPPIRPNLPSTVRPLEKLASRLFRDLAGIEIDSARAAALVSEAGQDRRTLIRNVILSPEARDGAVRRIVQRFEARDAGDNVFIPYRNAPAADVSEEWLWSLRATPNHAPYSARFATDEAWFRGICRDFFGFEATAEQISHHVGLIQRGEKTRDEIIAILYLQSGRVHFFRTYHRLFLRRDPTAAEMSTLASIPVRGTDTAVERILATDDYLFLALFDL